MESESIGFDRERRMAKNPFLAAFLNFLIWGTGYIYLGKRNPGYYLIPCWIFGLVFFASFYAPNEQIIIHGSVLSYNSIDQLSDVGVDVYDYDESLSSINFSTPIRHILTDSRGSYVFADLEPGRYILLFHKDGYNSAINYINISERGYRYELNAILLPKGESYIIPTYLIPEIIILERLGVHIPPNIEIFTWIFAIIISLAFAIDAFREAKKLAEVRVYRTIPSQ